MKLERFMRATTVIKSELILYWEIFKIIGSQILTDSLKRLNYLATSAPFMKIQRRSLSATFAQRATRQNPC